MPELPEVETIRRDAQKELADAQFQKVIFGTNGNELKLRIKRPIEEILPGKKILEVDRAGKVLNLKLSGDWHLIIRLLMTGRLLLRTNEQTDEFERCRFYLDDGRVLKFSDRGNFADIQLLTTQEWTSFKGQLGPEIGKEPFTAADFAQRLKIYPHPTVKEALLDQKITAGVGNIHADEALFRAKITPRAKPNQLSNDELNMLIDAIGIEFEEATDHRGTTIDSFVDLYGNSGTHQDYFLVYSRDNQPCLTCNTPISLIELSGRRTFFCPRCQPEAQLSLF